MNNNRTALLVLDLQKGIMAHFGDEAPSYLARAAHTINTARSAGVKVIYVTTTFRPGHPDVSKNNLSFARLSAMGGNGFIEGDPSVAISPEVKPVEGDILVVKKRVSAFSGSDLDLVLRSLGVDSLVLAGVATSGAVLSTIRCAADLDFRLTVLADLCLDRDPEVHRVLTEKIFPKQGEVLSAEQWVQGLAGGRE
ncbi:putative isochorismatase hydrolase protein [Achaetomium macrosporum]|uniref:Isochorismatase hydrolase protein n=1 Tax=Achaetomium macrosporum TaxID=79813 RepID=A0AAN7HE46_9PEZI|nr:putative isochorismatase hydrolase protein [Achaetomium macrosporum]